MSSRPRIVPHRTRVELADGRAGMVVGVYNATRRLVGGTYRIEQPARVHVVLDAGGKATVPVADVTVIR